MTASAELIHFCSSLENHIQILCRGVSSWRPWGGDDTVYGAALSVLCGKTVFFASLNPASLFRTKLVTESAN